VSGAGPQMHSEALEWGYWELGQRRCSLARWEGPWRYGLGSRHPKDAPARRLRGPFQVSARILSTGREQYLGMLKAYSLLRFHHLRLRLCSVRPVHH
jgi:hypothetical protein